MIHKPVLLKEVIEYFNPIPGGRFIDATIDGGGHAAEISRKILPDGKLLGIEWDNQLFKELDERVKNSEFENILLVNDSYVNLKKICGTNDFNNIDGILFDVGMSSWHVDQSGKGFSFQKDEPLDMRFNNQEEDGITAEEILNTWSKDRLANAIKEYGEERFADPIAVAIVNARRRGRIERTLQLVEIIKEAVPFWYRRGRIHFATRTFQALRISVNHELENISSGLEQAIDLLKVGGRLEVITFHSLEDRIVKNLFRTKSKEGILKIITKKPIRADFTEIRENPRSRSAKLRVAEKIILK